MRTIAVPSRIIAMSYELAPEVSEYYERGGEVSRLTTTPDGRLEFLRTQDILRRLLGPSPSTILDIGGATGAHAAWLTADGHQVTLVDPVASQVAVASANGIQGQVGDARDLPFGNGLFDAALLLGPLYHLLTEADRLRALEEAIRVVRPGGQVVAAAIGRFAPWLDKASKTRLSNDNDEPMLAEAHRTGRLRPPYIRFKRIHHLICASTGAVAQRVHHGRTGGRHGLRRRGSGMVDGLIGWATRRPCGHDQTARGPTRH